MPENPREPRGNRGCTNANPAIGAAALRNGASLFSFSPEREIAIGANRNEKVHAMLNRVSTVTHDNLRNYLST
jgi:hypothetical protein